MRFPLFFRQEQSEIDTGRHESAAILGGYVPIAVPHVRRRGKKRDAHNHLISFNNISAILSPALPSQSGGIFTVISLGDFAKSKTFFRSSSFSGSINTLLPLSIVLGRSRAEAMY